MQNAPDHIDLAGKFVIMLEEDLSRYTNQWPIISVSDDNDARLRSCHNMSFQLVSKKYYDATRIESVSIACSPDIKGDGGVYQLSVASRG